MNSTGYPAGFPLARPVDIARYDQFQASARTFAEFTAVFRDELVAAGFTQDDAMTVVTAWMHAQ